MVRSTTKPAAFLSGCEFCSENNGKGAHNRRRSQLFLGHSVIRRSTEQFRYCFKLIASTFEGSNNVGQCLNRAIQTFTASSRRMHQDDGSWFCVCQHIHGHLFWREAGPVQAIHITGQDFVLHRDDLSNDLIGE